MTDSRASITIVIPAYNIDKYIGSALESVLRQDPPFNQIVVIDDGSTDNTAKVISRFDDPCLVYHHQLNQGLGPARNKGIALAESEYLYFMDGDDILPEGMTRILHEMLEAGVARPDAVLFSAIDFSNESEVQYESSKYFERKQPGHYSTGADALAAALVTSSYPACAYLYVFRRTLLEHAPSLRFLNILHEDEVFTPALLLRCEGTIVTNLVMYHRRIRSGSIMTSNASERNVRGYLVAAKGWLEHGAAESSPKARLFYRQAYHFLTHALLCALKTGMSARETRALVSSVVPELAPGAGTGLRIARLSARASFAIARLRGDLHAVKAKLRMRM